MENLWILESYTLERENGESYRTGESSWYETFTNERGKLFSYLQKEFGRCTGKVYINEGTQVGWVFEKKTKFDDTNEFFNAATWIEVAIAEPEHKIFIKHAF